MKPDAQPIEAPINAEEFAKAFWENFNATAAQALQEELDDMIVRHSVVPDKRSAE